MVVLGLVGLVGLVVVSLRTDTEGGPISITVTETEAPVDAMATSIFWLSEAEVSSSCGKSTKNGGKKSKIIVEC